MSDDTPIKPPRPRAAPVVVRAGDTPKRPPPFPTMHRKTPAGGTLAPLNDRDTVPTRPDNSQPYRESEPPTSPRTSQAIAARLVRNWAACTVEDQRLIEALAVRLRPSVGE